MYETGIELIRCRQFLKAAGLVTGGALLSSKGLADTGLATQVESGHEVVNSAERMPAVFLPHGGVRVSQ